jgi:hypothetical protein
VTLVVSRTADTITFSTIGFIIILALIVVWRLIVKDRNRQDIRRIRFGIFYERDIAEDIDRPPELPPKVDDP